MSAYPKHNSGQFDWEANQDTQFILEPQPILNPNIKSNAIPEPNHKPLPHPDSNCETVPESNTKSDPDHNTIQCQTP